MEMPETKQRNTIESDSRSEPCKPVLRLLIGCNAEMVECGGDRRLMLNRRAYELTALTDSLIVTILVERA